MKKRSLITIVILLILWIVSGEMVNNPIKLPSFFDVAERMFELAKSAIFYEAFAYTLARSFFGLLLALFIGVLLGICSGISHKFEEYFEPIYTILKSIPNVSYILIVLIWTNSKIATCVIGFMVMFPMTYANTLSGMKSIENKYLDLMRIYPVRKTYKIFKVYLPLISHYIYASFSNGLGLTFKVGIMAEILGSVSPGMGRQFQLCRINVDMIGIFAWTIWLIVFLIVFESLLKLIENRLLKYKETD